MNRREALKRTALGAAGIGIGGPALLLQTSCSPKDVSFYIKTVGGALKEMQQYLPNSAQLISKAIAIASDFDKAYKDGEFTNAVAMFANLSGLLGQIASDAGVNNSTIKMALAVAGVAMRTIAVLLDSQSSQPVVAKAIRGQTSTAAKYQMGLIGQLADATAVDQIFQAVRF